MKREILNAHGVRVSLLMLDAAALSGNELAEIAANASEYRLSKAQNYRLERDRRLCLGAARLLDVMLGEFDTVEKSAPLRFTDSGKPYYPGIPVSFSIAHSYDFVLLAYTMDNVDIGCDIEKIRPVKHELARYVLGDRAYGQYSLLADADAERFFCGVWTKMESYVKATGEGGSALRGLSADKWQLSRPLPAAFMPEGYEGAVCVLERESLQM